MFLSSFCIKKKIGRRAEAGIHDAICSLFIQIIHSISLLVHESYPHCCVSSPHFIEVTSLAVIENWLIFCSKTIWILHPVSFSSNIFFLYYIPILRAHTEFQRQHTKTPACFYNGTVSLWLFPDDIQKISPLKFIQTKFNLFHQLKILDSVYNIVLHLNHYIAPFLKC